MRVSSFLLVLFHLEFRAEIPSGVLTVPNRISGLLFSASTSHTTATAKDPSKEQRADRDREQGSPSCRSLAVFDLLEEEPKIFWDSGIIYPYLLQIPTL